MLELDLQKTLNDHIKWLNSEGGARANLSGADLREANLRGADLRWTDLGGANLSRADLRKADLNGAKGRDES